MGEELNSPVVESIAKFTFCDFDGNTVLSGECPSGLSDAAETVRMPPKEYTIPMSYATDISAANIDRDLSRVTFDLSYEEQVQARKHRKKRINKKWLKRYGYKTVTKTLKDCEFLGIHDGMWSFALRRQ